MGRTRGGRSRGADATGATVDVVVASHDPDGVAHPAPGGEGPGRDERVGIDVPASVPQHRRDLAGDCEGLTPEEMRAAHPRATDLRKMDKIGYRYPRGESYFDLISRLEPCIQEMESYAEPLLIVSHQAILRCIFAYLTGVDRSRRRRWRRRFSKTSCTRSTSTRRRRCTSRGIRRKRPRSSPCGISGRRWNGACAKGGE